MLLKPINMSAIPISPPERSGEKRFLLRHHEGDDYILEIDHTTISNYLECERKGRYNMIDARVPHRAPALVFGSAIHKALESFYKGELILANIIAAGADELLTMPNAISEWRNYELYAKLITKYVEKYSREDTFSIETHNDVPLIECAFGEPLTTLSINHELAFPLQNLVAKFDGLTSNLYCRNLHIIWTGVCDLIISDVGSLKVLDHKTTSIEGPSFWKQFELSQQFMGYIWAAQKITGKTMIGAIANVIYTREPAKTAATQKAHEAKMLMRQFFPYKPEQIVEWEKNMIVHVENLAHNLVTGSFPMHTNACVNKYGVCPYHDVCAMPASSRATMLASDQFATNTWSPLL